MNHNVSFPVVWVLHGVTARAMGVPFRPGWDALRTYAAFTCEQIKKTPASELPAMQERLYRAAVRMGALLRRVLIIRTDARAQRVLFGLYRCIGIELNGECPGNVTVCRCYFSEFYTPEMCRVMSAMDRGIFAGLFGGGELRFTSRITEGCPCCRASFTREETRSAQ